jgi:hypothetical protein
VLQEYPPSDRDAADVAGLLLAMRQLRVLEVSGGNLTTAGWQTLVDAMAGAPWMERLEIDDVDAPQDVTASDGRIELRYTSVGSDSDFSC